MGTTYSTIQIRNPHQNEQFKFLLCGYFQKKGLVPATEEDAEYSYWLTLPNNSTWATLGSADYQTNTVNKEILEIAVELKTHCVLASVWDSDFFELRLFNPAETDYNILAGGDVPIEEVRTMCKRELWEPLLAEGKTWEQIQEICNGEFTFAEDALCELVPLLNMNPIQVTNAYGCCEEIATDTPDVITLYFKRVQNIAVKKAPSLEKMFKQVFGEGLAPLGFVKLKGKQPYFVRMIGDEILHVVTYTKEWSGADGIREFSVRGGVATVYGQNIDLTCSPRENSNWLGAVSRFYIMLKSSIDENLRKSIHEFSYKEDDAESMIREVKRSFDMTKQFVLPILDAATDLKSCIEYFHVFHPGYLRLNDNLNYCKEGFLLILTNNRDDYIERMEKAFARTAQLMKEGKIGLSQKDFEAKNTESLRSYGLEL